MRVRFRFTKLGKVRFTSHRDVARLWERALRRVGLPVARTQGFSPRPKVHFGLALSTAHESLAEFVDVDLVDGAVVDLDTLPTRLSAAFPEGIEVTAAAPVDPGAPSLQHAVTSTAWEIEVLGLDPEALSARVEGLLAAGELVTTRNRKGKDVSEDVRPHLLHLHPSGPVPGGSLLVAELATLTRSLRPGELVALLGDDAREGRVRRTHQFTEHDGSRVEPLAPPASAAPGPSAPHALERAS